MENENEKTKKNDFFRFYEERDGFYTTSKDGTRIEETRPIYEKIIEAFAKSGYIPEEYIVRDENGEIDKAGTLDKVVERCRELDDQEVERTNGNVKEKNIGLMGFFRSLGYKLGKDDEKEIKKMGEDALEKFDNDSTVNDNMSEAEKIAYYEAKAFLAQLAAGPYFPRLTCTSASHFMGKGRLMQIGCSQGKTSIVAMTTYVQAMQGKKVFSTSSSPGLVPENYDEARKFYEKVGIAEEFCAISQNPNDNVKHIVLFHDKKKYEVRADGQIWIETEVKGEDGKSKKEMVPTELSLAELADLKLVVGSDGKYDFDASVQKMMAEKKIIMGDTITLAQYQHLMPERNEEGVISDSFLIVDEADAELLDTQPQELLGEEYSKEEQAERLEIRKRARDAVAKFKGEPSELEKLAEKEDLPLEFVLDAYEAQTNYSNPNLYTVRDGKLYILNPNTNVMIPASQGLTQAILVNDENLEYIPEIEVVGETDIPELFSNFEIASLMSGTMQDKGISQENMTEEYRKARQNYYEKCGPGVATSVEEAGVMEWRLVTPLTRDEKGAAIVTRQGIKRDTSKSSDAEGKDIETAKEDVQMDWHEYLEKYGEELEEKWREEVNEEAKVRSASGRPVMISVYGDRNPTENIQDPLFGGMAKSYTDKNQIAQQGDKHKIGDDKCLFVQNGVGEVAAFDDFYGRGYTFKFIELDANGEIKQDKEGKPLKSEKGGHVLITALPQNSRNLEQFLFRVARGGDKGSSSIIISPTDPVLTKYLEKLEKEQGKEAANEYFRGVMNGEIKIDKIVTDIYPEETKNLFNQRAKLAGAREFYTDKLERNLMAIDNKEVRKIYYSEFKKQMVSHMKYYRTCEITDMDNMDIERKEKTILITIAKSLIKQGVVKKVEDIMDILPADLTKEELAEIIPDKEQRKEVEEKYIFIVNEKDSSLKNDEKKEKGRDIKGEIHDAAEEDVQYNTDQTIESKNNINRVLNREKSEQEATKQEENLENRGD